MSTRFQIAISCAVWVFLTTTSSLAHDQSRATRTVLQNAFCCTDETPFVEHRESRHRRQPGSEQHRSSASMIAIPETSTSIAEGVLFRSGMDLKDGPALVFARDTQDTLMSSQSLVPLTQSAGTYPALQSFPEQQQQRVDLQYSQSSRPTDSSPEWFLQMLPEGIIYRSCWAGLHEPRLGVQLTAESSGQSFWDPTLGARIGLVRYGTDDSLHPEGWQIDLEGAAMARLTLDYWRDLDTVDSRGGIPLTYGIDNWQFKLGYYHLSSHLGDEFAINNPGSLDNRINYVRDAIVVGVSWYPVDIMRFRESDWSCGRQNVASENRRCWWSVFFLILLRLTANRDKNGAPMYISIEHLRCSNQGVTRILALWASPVTDSITEFLEAVRRGEPGASEALLEKVYDSLRRIAAGRLGREFGQEDLQPTELVHEAWLRLGASGLSGWENRFHFFSAAAEAMRRTLIDNARRRQSGKRRASTTPRMLSDEACITTPLADELLDLDDALSEMEQRFPVHVRVVKLKFFAGMTTAEIAEVTNVSVATTERYWAFARSWLHQRMGDSESGGQA